jgi:ABC-2 type transport system permease protein
MSIFSSRIPFPFRLLGFQVARILPGWLFIGAFIFVFQIAVCGIVHDNDNVKALIQFIKIMPPIVRNMLGGNFLTPDNPAALITIGHQHPLILILYMVYAVGTPTALIVGEVQRGTMELILSRSVTRSQVFICAAIPTVVGMFLLTFIMFLGTMSGTTIYKFDRPVPLFGFFQLAINGAFLASTVAAIAMFVASFCRERGTAVGITVAYLVTDYFLNLISTWWPRMSFLHNWSLFRYVNGPKIFRSHMWPIREIVILSCVGGFLLLLGWLIWRRRDLPN